MLTYMRWSHQMQEDVKQSVGEKKRERNIN